MGHKVAELVCHHSFILCEQNVPVELSRRASITVKHRVIVIPAVHLAEQGRLGTRNL